MGKKLSIGNLSSAVTSTDLRELFGKFGVVERADIAMHPDTGPSRGAGHVSMADESSATTAVHKLNFTNYDGLLISVSRDRTEHE